MIAFEQRQHLATLLNVICRRCGEVPDMIYGAHCSDAPAMRRAVIYLYALPASCPVPHHAQASTVDHMGRCRQHLP
jgi:hypothetical protein